MFAGATVVKTFEPEFAGWRSECSCLTVHVIVIEGAMR